MSSLCDNQPASLPGLSSTPMGQCQELVEDEAVNPDERLEKDALTSLPFRNARKSAVRSTYFVEPFPSGPQAARLVWDGTNKFG